jgi:hypothetical protein
MATLVLPDPVGAHTSMFSLLYRAHSLTRLCVVEHAAHVTCERQSIHGHKFSLLYRAHSLTQLCMVHAVRVTCEQQTVCGCVISMLFSVQLHNSSAYMHRVCIGLARTINKYGVYTVFLAGNRQIRLYTVYMYGSGQP